MPPQPGYAPARAAEQVGVVKATRSAVGAGRIQEFRDRSGLAVVGRGGPVGQRSDRVQIDLALVQLMVGDVADERNVHHEAVADIVLDAEAEVQRLRRRIA